MISLFNQKAPGIIDKLMTDLGLTSAQAAGILGNIGVETGGFLYLQEIGAAPGYGGYGWCQWTGTRRRLYMQYCTQHKLDPAADETNYSFLVNDLKTTYRYCLNDLKKCKSANEAAVVFEQRYEYAGVPNMITRINYANQAWVAWNNTKTKK